MKLDKELSKQIDILKFGLIVGVVFIHINTNDIVFKSQILTDLKFFISEILSRSSVPLFFAISGFLFFNNLSPSIENFFKKYKNRFFSLIIPFLFWNLIIFLFFFIAQNLPLTQ